MVPGFISLYSLFEITDYAYNLIKFTQSFGNKCIYVEFISDIKMKNEEDSVGVVAAPPPGMVAALHNLPAPPSARFLVNPSTGENTLVPIKSYSNR